MKIVCTSDLHGYLPNIPECDILLIAGDITPRWCTKDVNMQLLWFNTNWSEWLRCVPAKNVVYIAGNHDHIFLNLRDSLRPNSFTHTTRHYLQDSMVEVCGLKVYGTPWQKTFGHGWAYNLYTPQLDMVFEQIPDCDILVTHSPPYGYGDSADRCPDDEAYDPSKTYPQELTGSEMLLNKIHQIQPKLHVFGHIHKGFGVYQIGKTISINATFVNEKYIPTHEPYVVEVDV